MQPDPNRLALLDELARVALATDRPCPILHALEVACGAVGIDATQRELDEAIERRTRTTIGA